jgi:8-oxo-dGTP diphosphatase
MAGKTIHAAGGIVVRKGARPLIAVVQRAKDDRWVLPRGKLKRKEQPRSGARREAFEETGHRVELHEFIGAITYRAQGRPKLVRFWHMRAAANPSHDPMRDIAAVAWLPLREAVKRLTYPLEKMFLDGVGRAPRTKVLRRRSRDASLQKRKRASGPARPKTRRAPCRNRATRIAEI